MLSTGYEEYWQQQQQITFQLMKVKHNILQTL